MKPNPVNNNLAPSLQCDFRAWGMMPPCILPPDHTGDHADGFGGHYTRNSDVSDTVRLKSRQKEE